MSTEWTSSSASAFCDGVAALIVPKCASFDSVIAPADSLLRGSRHHHLNYWMYGSSVMASVSASFDSVPTLDSLLRGPHHQRLHFLDDIEALREPQRLHPSMVCPLWILFREDIFCFCMRGAPTRDIRH